MSGGTRPLPPAEAALAMLLAPSPAGKAGNAEAQLQLLRRLQEFPESFLPPAQQQQHCHHPHPHCQEVEGQGTPADWQATQKLITALLSLVSSPSATSTSSSSPPANLELRVHATLALTTLLVLSHPPASGGSSHDGDDDRRAAAPALARVLSHAASTLLQLVASSQHQQKRQQQKRGGAERGAVAPAPLRRVALEGLVELEAAFPGLLWEEREQLKAPAAGTTVGVAALLALVLANGTAAGVGGITRSGSDAAPATGAETRASMAAVLDRLPLLSPPRQLLAARRLAAAASAARVPPVVFKPQLLRLMASREPPLVAAALLMKRAFGDALFAPDEEALLARRLAVAAAHPGAGAGAADGARLLASRWLLRFPENSPLHDDDDDAGCCECRGGGVGSDAGGGGGVGPDCSAGDGVDGHGGDAAGRDAAGGGDGAAACGGRCHGAAGGRGGTERAPLSLTPAVATSLFPTVFQGCPPLSPSSSRQDGACTASLLLSRFQLLCLIHCEDDFGEAHGGSGAGEGADRLLGCLRAMASDLPRRSRQRRQQQQQNKRQQQQKRHQQQQRSVPCPFFGAALLYFRHFRQNAPALRGLRQLLLDAFLEDVRLAPRLVRLVDRMQQHEEEEEAAEALAAATALESSSSSTSSSTSSLTSASPPSPASPGGGGDGFPVLLLRSLQEAIVGATSGSRSQPPRRPLERLPYELPVLERAAREPRVPAAPTLLFLLRLVSPADDAGPAAGVLGDWAGGCGILAVCRHLLARPGGGAADAVARPLLSRLLLALARSPLCDVDVRDRAGALAGLQAALSPAKLRALLAVPAAAAALAAARCGRHRHHDHHHDAAVPVPASPIAEVPCLVPLAEPALALALVDPDRDGGDGDIAGAGGDGDINEDAALPVYLGWLRGDKNGGAGGSERWGRPDEAPVGLRVALRDDWSRRHGRAYAVQLHFVGARAEDVRLPYLGPAGDDGGGGGAVVTARLRPSWSRGSGRRYRDVTLAPTAVFADGTGRTCRCRLPALPVPLTSLLRPLAPALSPGARSRLFEELWALFTTAAASDGSRVSDRDDDADDAVDPAACAQSVLRLGGGAGSEDGAVAERLERGLRRFAVPACARGPAGRPAFRAAMMLPPGRHVLVRVDGARGPQGGGGGPVSVLVTVATDDWRLLPLIGSHLARVATVKGDGL